MRITEGKLRSIIRSVIIESINEDRVPVSFQSKLVDKMLEVPSKYLENVDIVSFLERCKIKVQNVDGNSALEQMLSNDVSTNKIHGKLSACVVKEPKTSREAALVSFMCVLSRLCDVNRVHARQNQQDRNATLTGLLKNKEIVKAMGGEDKIKDMFKVSAKEINDSQFGDDLIILAGSMEGSAVTSLLCSIKGSTYILKPGGSIISFIAPEKENRGFDPARDEYDVDSQGFLVDPKTGMGYNRSDGKTPVMY